MVSLIIDLLLSVYNYYYNFDRSINFLIVFVLLYNDCVSCFNSDKSKLFIFTKHRNLFNTNAPIQLHFMEGYIVESRNEKHLGNIIGQHCKQSVKDSSANDFYVQANTVLSHFLNANYHVRYKLFQTYCCQLWDYQDNATHILYVA